MSYLIDGHNLIACLPDISLTDPNSAAKLVIKLRGFAAARRKGCTVIFDRGIPGGKSTLSTPSVKVAFAPSNTDADALLKARIRKRRDAVNWTLVSSDNEVRQVAKACGMKLMSSAEFAQRLQPRKPDEPDEEADPGGDVHPPQPSKDEVNEWLDLFDGGGDD